ncbi:hypothetical protein E8E13_003208 [Curvularia kusanoi]|uniref:Uncharacterized protein n=1 Tax=Curvularia kusanoi TaxID=90978 RepID=A0A9P4WEB4_CURKU|nr:hypothetical protein E8E13_003208 [Curvularia kusanoi]
MFSTQSLNSTGDIQTPQHDYDLLNREQPFASDSPGTATSQPGSKEQIEIRPTASEVQMQPKGARISEKARKILEAKFKKEAYLNVTEVASLPKQTGVSIERILS